MVLVVLLIGVLVLGGRNIYQRRQSVSADQLLASYRQRLIDTTLLSSRSDQVLQLHALIGDLEALESQARANPLLLSRLRALQQEVDAVYRTASGETVVEKLPVYYDFRLVAPDFVAQAAHIDDPGRLIVFLDRGRSRLLSLSLETKQPQVLSLGEGASQSLDLWVAGRKAYALSGNTVIEASLPLDQLGRVLIEGSQVWQTPHSIGHYEGNFYVLDTGKRQLFRYTAENLNSSPSAWFRTKEGVDFDDITSMQVDGNIWLGTRTGRILKFTRGEQQPFTVQDLAIPFESDVLLATSVTSGNLYVLEPKKQRLVTIAKDGVYQKTITSPDFSTATDLTVDETTNTAYILAGSLVYSVSLE